MIQRGGGSGRNGVNTVVVGGGGSTDINDHPMMCSDAGGEFK